MTTRVDRRGQVLGPLDEPVPVASGPVVEVPMVMTTFTLGLFCLMI